MPRARLPAALVLAAALAGCGNVNLGALWPFGEGGPGRVEAAGPVNALEYRCDGGRRFFVRTLDANAVWVILPDRELRMERAGGNRFRAGRVTLEIDGTTASLDDTPVLYAGCKTATAK